MKIVFQVEGQPVSIMTPCDCGIPIHQIGMKDVPEGQQFWIIEDSEVPEDRTFRNAWDLDLEKLGEPSGKGDPQSFAKWAEEQATKEQAAEEDA